MQTSTMEVHKIAQEPGVNDIQPLKARLKFAQAVAAERRGDDAKASQCLQGALDLLK
jgi:hypothetical protein